MRIYDILNALLFFVYRLLELIGILFSILIIPFSILAASTMDMKDAVSYGQYIINQRFNRLRTFSFTVKVTVNNNIPRLHLQHYDDDIAEVTKRINDMKFPSIRACITKAFQEAGRYSFVIFQTDDSATKFIQIRMDTGVYIVDLPLVPSTLNRDYAIDFIKMLRAKGFTKTPPNTFYRNKTYCIDAIDSDMTIIDANLGKDKDYAVNFCSMIFSKIFRTKTIPEVLVG